MKNPLHATAVLSCGIPPRFTRVARHMMGMTGILMALLFQGASQLQGQTPQDSYEVRLKWNASTSTDVTGYRIHYGTASGAYTGSVAVGNVTSGTVSGLAEGATYHFTVSAVSVNGLESDFSNEVSFKPGLHTSRIRTNATGETVMIVRGLIGRQYDIEASVDLHDWTLIDTVTIPEGGSFEFSDPDAPLFARRFYRTRAIP